MTLLKSNIDVKYLLLMDNGSMIDGWEGSGNIDCPDCDNYICINYGKHPLVESLYCKSCDNWVMIEWDKYLNLEFNK